MIVLGIYGKFLIDLLICLKTCRSDFFFQGKMCTPEKSSAFQRFCTPERARPESGAQFVQAWRSNFTQNEMFLKCVHVIGFAWKQIRFTNAIFTLVLLLVQCFSGLSELEIYSCVVNLILKVIVNQWIKPNKTMCEVRSELPVMTPERHQWRTLNWFPTLFCWICC